MVNSKPERYSFSNHELLHKRITEIMNDLNIDYFPSAKMLKNYSDGNRILKEIYKSGNFKTVACEFGLTNCSEHHIPRSESIKGKKFGRLVVIEMVECGINSRWKCICDCGNEKIVSQDALKGGHIQSCGCIRRELLIERNKTVLSKHLLTNHPLFKKWSSIKVRCNYPSSISYKNYGERGIKMCDEWSDNENGFLNFYKWAISNGWEDGLTIDRIDPEGNYEPNNCRWVTNKIQQRNKRNTVVVEYLGQKISMQELCEDKNLSSRAVYQKLRRGIDIYRAIGEER